MFKSLFLLACAFLLAAPVTSAVAENTAALEALDMFAISFAELHSEALRIQALDQVPAAERAGFVELLRNMSSRFKRWANSVPDGLAMPFRDYAKVLRDQAKLVESGSNRGFGGGFIYPTIAQGVMAGLFTEDGSGLILSTEQVAAFRSTADREFGDAIQGDEAFNGETGFAQAVSLVYTGAGILIREAEEAP